MERRVHPLLQLPQDALHLAAQRARRAPVHQRVHQAQRVRRPAPGPAAQPAGSEQAAADQRQRVRAAVQGPRHLARRGRDALACLGLPAGTGGLAGRAVWFRAGGGQADAPGPGQLCLLHGLPDLPAGRRRRDGAPDRGPRLARAVLLRGGVRGRCAPHAADAAGRADQGLWDHMGPRRWGGADRNYAWRPATEAGTRSRSPACAALLRGAARAAHEPRAGGGLAAGEGLRGQRDSASDVRNLHKVRDRRTAQLPAGHEN